MSAATYLVTYTGKDVVELKGAGVFAAGVSAFLPAELAAAAKGNADFKVVEAMPASPVLTTRADVEAAEQKDKGGPPAEVPAAEAKPAPKKEEKKEAPAAPPPPKEEKKPEPPKAEEKKPEAKGEEKKAEEKKGEEKPAEASKAEAAAAS